MYIVDFHFVCIPQLTDYHYVYSRNKSYKIKWSSFINFVASVVEILVESQYAAVKLKTRVITG